MPGSHEELLFHRLIPAVSRAGRAVDLDACAALAIAIQRDGHRARSVRRAAKAMGLDPRYLPRQRR
jgi:hypothetical protein